MTRVLLTGAATLMGAEVLRGLTQAGVDEIRVMAPSDEPSRARMLQRLEGFIGILPQSVSTVVGDLRLPRFGLPARDWDELAQSFDFGIHCAQRDIIDDDPRQARQANVLPIEGWIQLLNRNRDLRLHHLSTAFIGGTRRGLLTEFDLDCGQAFHNAWERSKFEAEVRLRESNVTDRVAIYRPSHLLGRSDDGAAFDLSGSYPLLAALVESRVLPGDGRARIDFIPADYAAAAMVALAQAGATGTFHLACGWHESLTVKHAATLIANAHGRNRGALLLPRALAWPLRVAGTSKAGDLLHQGPVFDTYLADRALAPLGIRRPPAERWLEAVVRAADARGWSAGVSPAEQAPSRRGNGGGTPPAQPAGTPALRKFHQIGDVNVAYRDVGEGDPVVFLHGFSGAQSWDGVVELIATRRRALIVETLGIGETTAPNSADFSLPAQAARVRGLLSALDIPSAHIVGNEIGGIIAQFFAVRWPHIVESLTLSNCDAHGPWPPPQVKKRSRLLADARLKRLLRSFDTTDVSHMNQLLGQLEVPTMIVWGAEDSPSWARRLYDSIPGARRLELIPFAGVACHQERPDLFAKYLSEFLDASPSS